MARDLTANFPSTILVVLHVPPNGISRLPEVIDRAGPLPARHARDGEPIEKGRIHVAPPNLHLTVRPSETGLSGSTRVNRSRPAVDVLFQSAARVYGRRVVGVILSGALDDGTYGLMAVKLHGGLAIAQDPDEALFDGMSSSAVACVDVAHVAPLDRIAGLLTQLVGERRPAANGGGFEMTIPTEEIERADEIIAQDRIEQERGERHGAPAVYSCPECGGVIWQLDEENVARFQCHFGHVYSLQSPIVEQAEDLEQAPWYAIRSRADKASLTRQMIQRHRTTISPELLARYQKQADRAQGHSDSLKKLIESGLFSGEYDEELAERVSEQNADTRRGE